MATIGLEKKFASVFISYGGPDEEFALQLHSEFESRGVESFIFCRDAKGGEPLHKVMRQAVNTCDRVLLICSKTSLDRPGVKNEIHETLKREAREGGTSILIPLTIDDYVFDDFSKSNEELAQILLDRVVLDFRGATTSGTQKFDDAFKRLLEAIEKTS